MGKRRHESEDQRHLRFVRGRFTTKEHGLLDQGRCPDCERLVDWMYSTMEDRKIVICCGGHGHSFVHVVDVDSYWAGCVKRFGTQIESPLK